ncbi:MAG: acetyl-CoA acetyltransferase [Thaumarchaeota archaeon]|nr:acetyl-CoA acetyltransferase [Nitrososphaerota archaeon]
MRQQRVGIIGAGYEGFRPLVSDLSTRELMFEAASKAYDDASIDPRRDVGSFICCTEDLWEGWSITDEMVPDQIGAAARPLCTIPADAVTGLGNAVMHILAGVADVVVLEAHSKSADVLDKDAVERLGQEPTMIRPLGASSDVLAALEMDGFLRSTGYDMDDVNEFLISSKKKALRNARASYGAELSAEDLAGGGVISSPLRRLDKAPFAEAGIVLVLASEAWAKKNGRDAVFVDGVAWNSSLPWFDGGDFGMVGYARDSYRKALERAGVKKGLEAFDILELDDTYSYKALQHLHSLAKSRAEEKRVTSGAGPALNPSGGSLGVGNLLEASAIHRLLECYLQLKGEAGPVQVKGAERALVQSWRGIPTATGGVAVLSR